MKHVVGLSGGKDSTALALRLAELNPGTEYEYICTPTGNELPEMFAHWEKLEGLLDQPLRQLGVGYDLYELIEQTKMIPNHRARFCTRVLKIEPTIEYMDGLPEGSVLYVGLRADEEERRGIFGEDINIRFPLREWGWGLAEVLEYLELRQVSIPGRTDCGVCFHQRLGEWWNLWKDHPEEFAKGVAVEIKYEHTFRSAQRDSWPASLEGLGQEFGKGRIPKGASANLDLFDGDGACRVCSL